MIFTKNDFERIEEYLRSKSFRDSDLPEADSLSGSELLAVVQDRNNKKISVDAFNKQVIDNLPDKYIKTRNIADLAITTPKINDLAVTTPKIANSTVTEDKLATNSVTTHKIKDKNVTNSKIADKAITREKIAGNTLNIEHLDNGLRAILLAATGVPGELLEQLQENSENMAVLNDAVFPITLTLSVAYNGSQHTASFTVKEKGVDFIADTLVLAKTLVDGTTKILSNTPAASGSFSSPIESNCEVFKIDVTKAGRTSKSASATRYIFYAGASADGNISEDVINGLSRVSAAGVGFNPTVTTGDNQYIWLVVPSNLSISRVTSAGFDVTLQDAVTITTALGSFKAYRTVNKLTAQKWNLIIS